MKRAWLKYFQVAATTVHSNWTYLWDQLFSTIHLVIIMFVFVQLWKVTYAAGGTDVINGYTLKEMIWYLVGTEAIILSMPRVHATLDQEVKNGDLAIRLNKPYSYLLFHYSAYAGEAVVKVGVTLLAGGLTAYLLVGGFAFRWEALPLLLAVYLVTGALNFCYGALIGLASFWTEDVSGLYFILERAKWILGGLLLPVEVYPDSVRWLVEALPFRYMIAGPARLFVKFDWQPAGALLASQAGWLLVFGFCCWGVYRLGVRRVDVNGG